MFVLGLQGSPRTKGNTSILLSTFLEEAQRIGAFTQRLDVARMNISPCLECGTCDEEGFCPVDDDMEQVYPMLRQADIIVMATPIFFYGATAQLKALIDRSQALWSRKYVHKLVDPGRRWRRGFLLSLGATKGKNLFDGVTLTAKYFFDAVGASFDGSLTYRQIENAGEIAKHPSALKDAREKAGEIATPFLKRKKLLFVCTENACRSQMASEKETTLRLYGECLPQSDGQCFCPVQCRRQDRSRKRRECAGTRDQSTYGRGHGGKRHRYGVSQTKVD